MDFTISALYQLLQTLQNDDLIFQSFEESIKSPARKSIVLRHDVDLKPQNSLLSATLENKLGIKGSYYFRIVPESYNTHIIKQIAQLGQEIGYHYETMDTCQGNVDKAYDEFCRNLEMFREIYPVQTICMHGSPRSRFDNREIWKKYDYRKLGITGEPYFDVNFNEVFYLTDTGRRWDGYKFSVRDKVPQQEQWAKQGLIFRSTNEIIAAANQNKLPAKIMITIHPQRWTNKPIPWLQEWALQNLKNTIKYLIIHK